MFKKILLLTGFIFSGLLICEVALSQEFVTQTQYPQPIGMANRYKLINGGNSAIIELDEDGNVKFDNGSGISKTDTFTRNESTGVISTTNMEDKILFGLDEDAYDTFPAEQQTDIILYANSIAGYMKAWDPSSTLSAPYGFDGFFFNFEKLAFKFGKEPSGGADADDFGTYSFSCCHKTTASGNSSTAFGFNNVASGNFSAVLGGGALIAAGEYSALIGGKDNSIDGGTGGNVIIGGNSQQITIAADNGIIAGGSSNTNHSGFGNALLGGESNITQSTKYASIIGGLENITLGSGNYNAIINANQVTTEGDHITVIGNYTESPALVNDDNVVAVLERLLVNKVDRDDPVTDDNVYLDVRGEIRYLDGVYPVASELSHMQMLPGKIAYDGTKIGTWPGYSSSQTGTGTYRVIFTTPFSSIPSCTITPVVGTRTAITARITSLNASGFVYQTMEGVGINSDSGVDFHCMGERNKVVYTETTF